MQIRVLTCALLVEGVRAGPEDTGTRDSREGERGQCGSRRRHQGGTLRRGPSSRLVRPRALGHPPPSLPLQVSTLLARYDHCHSFIND